MLIAANWKMHGDRAFLAAYFEGAAGLSWPTEQTHLVFPPATLLERAAGAAAKVGMVPGAQAIHGAADGAHRRDDHRDERARVVVGTRNIKPPRNCYVFLGVKWPKVHRCCIKL